MSKDIDNLFAEIDRRLCGISGSLMGAKAVLNHGGTLSWEMLDAIKEDADGIGQATRKLRKLVKK